jgi:hypothetical protein
MRCGMRGRFGGVGIEIECMHAGFWIWEGGVWFPFLVVLAGVQHGSETDRSQIYVIIQKQTGMQETTFFQNPIRFQLLASMNT